MTLSVSTVPLYLCTVSQGYGKLPHWSVISLFCPIFKKNYPALMNPSLFDSSRRLAIASGLATLTKLGIQSEKCVMAGLHCIEVCQCSLYYSADIG